MCNVKIFSCAKRESLAVELSIKLGLCSDDIIFDGRKSRCESFCYEVSKAWEKFDVSDEGGWSMLVQDDVDVCNNFIQTVEKICKSHQDTIFSFFPYYYMGVDVCVDPLSPFWQAEIISGCCIAVPNKYVTSMVQYMRRQKNLSCGEDLVIGWFAKDNKIPILTTIPSLVQHIGDVSILDPSKPIRRTQYFERDPVANWTSQKINKL